MALRNIPDGIPIRHRGSARDSWQILTERNFQKHPSSNLQISLFHFPTSPNPSHSCQPGRIFASFESIYRRPHSTLQIHHRQYNFDEFICYLYLQYNRKISVSYSIDVGLSILHPIFYQRLFHFLGRLGALAHFRSVDDVIEIYFHPKETRKQEKKMLEKTENLYRE